MGKPARVIVPFCVALVLSASLSMAETQWWGAMGSTWNNPGSALLSTMVVGRINAGRVAEGTSPQPPITTPAAVRAVTFKPVVPVLMPETVAATLTDDPQSKTSSGKHSSSS